MATTVKDRVSSKPNRFKIKNEDGSERYVTIERADEPTVEGTKINKALFDSISSEINSKCPIYHATNGNEYGLATDSNFGHARITSASTTTTGGALSMESATKLNNGLTNLLFRYTYSGIMSLVSPYYTYSYSSKIKTNVYVSGAFALDTRPSGVPSNVTIENTGITLLSCNTGNNSISTYLLKDGSVYRVVAIDPSGESYTSWNVNFSVDVIWKATSISV